MEGLGRLIALEVFIVLGIVLAWAWRELVLVERARRASRGDDDGPRTLPDDRNRRR